MAECFVCRFLVAVGPLADGEVCALSLITFTAVDGEWDDGPIAFLEAAIHLGTSFYHVAHPLVSHNVARLHRRNKIMDEMKVKPHIAQLVTLLIVSRGSSIRSHIDVFFAMPNERAHCLLLRFLQNGATV